jgi:curli biogenesis system outer membrane secretion channel CsgG
MSETLIIKTLKKQNQAINLTAADLVKLQSAGVSENIINVMEDPASTPSPNATAASQSAPGTAPPPAVTAAAANTLVAAAKAAPTPTPVPTSIPTTASATVTPAVAPTPVPANATKKRVAVDDFDYSTVMTSVQAVFGTNQNIGKGIRAMLTNKLAQQGKVVLVERGKIDMIMKEQDRNASNRVKQGTGGGIGKIHGADAMLLGDITIFGRDDKRKGVGAGAFGGGWIGGAAGALTASRKEDKAVVAITYRLVDAETSEVIATGEARGESSRKSSGFAAMAAGFSRGAYGAGAGAFDMTSSNFAETIIGEATQNCVNKLADVINTQADAMKKSAHEVEASVADVAGSSLTITAGANDGVLAGDVFEILKVVREVKDPGTNEVLDRITEKVGEMTVVNVRDKIATGSYSGQTAAIAYLARKKI